MDDLPDALYGDLGRGIELEDAGGLFGEYVVVATGVPRAQALDTSDETWLGVGQGRARSRCGTRTGRQLRRSVGEKPAARDRSAQVSTGGCEISHARVNPSSHSRQPRATFGPEAIYTAGTPFAHTVGAGRVAEIE